MIKNHLALCGSGEISGAAKGVPADEGWRPRFGRRAFGQEVSPPLRGVRRRSRSCYLGPFRERVSRSGVLQAAVHLLVLALALAPRVTGPGSWPSSRRTVGGLHCPRMQNGVQGARHPRDVLELRTRPRRRRSELYPMLLSHGFSSNSFRIFSATSNSMVPCSRSQLIHQINLRDNYDVIPLALLVWAPSTCVYMNW